MDEEHVAMDMDDDMEMEEPDGDGSDMEDEEEDLVEDPGSSPFQQPSSGPGSTPTSTASSPPVTEELLAVYPFSGKPLSIRRGPGRPRKEGKPLSRTTKSPVSLKLKRARQSYGRGAPRRVRSVDNSDATSVPPSPSEETGMLDPETGALVLLGDRGGAIVSEEPPYFPEQWPGKVCAVCNLSERSQLGQGELLRLSCPDGWTPSRVALPALPDSLPSEPEICIGDKSPRGTGPVAVTCRRQKSFNKCRNPATTSEYVDELTIIGYTEEPDVASVFDNDNTFYIHQSCAMWSSGVVKNEMGEMPNLASVVVQSLSRKCSNCGHHGASLVCKVATCTRLYHFPCATAAGAFQDTKTVSMFCSQHLAQVALVYDSTSDVSCITCYALGDVTNLMFCSSCGQHHHGACVGLAQLPGVRAGWQCRDCKVCQICRSLGDESKLMSCELCDKAYHAQCLRPIVTSVPKYGWKCKCCRICGDCGSRTPGAGQSSRWHAHYTVCDSCYQQRNKGFSCPLCHKAYRAHAYREMVQCSFCRRFVHPKCDPEADLQAYKHRKDANPEYEYVCLACKNLSAANRQLIGKRKDSTEDGPEIMLSQDAFGYEDPYLLDMDMGSLERGVEDGRLIGLGKGKPYCAGKIAKKRLGMPGRPKGYGKGLPGKLGQQRRRGLLEMGRKRGPKSKMRGIFGVPGVGLQRPTADSGRAQDDEPGNENRLVLVSAKDKYVLTQDVCVMCGALGTDQEGCLIACAQCGQCYHPYCVNINKVTKVILQKGWRCLDCSICEGCGQKNDEARLILCDECDISYHIYCMDPPLEYVPTGTWKCKWCAMCQTCGAGSPGLNSQWMNSYSECGPCASLNTCPCCLDMYVEGELVINCSKCERWLHGACDSIKNDLDAERCSEHGYVCVQCRPKDVPPPHLLPPALPVRPPSPAKSPEQPQKPASTTHYFVDGVYLSESGLNTIKALSMDGTQQGVRKKRKKLTPLLDKEAGIMATIESVVAGSSIETNMQDTTAKLELVDVKEEPQELYKEGMIWTPKTDGAPPEGFTVYTTETGVTMLRRKRQRNLQKLGIGGFLVRMRGTKTGQDNDEVDTLPGQNSGLGETALGAPLDSDKPKRKPVRRKPKGKLAESYPVYLQEAFFGRDLLDTVKEKEPDSSSAGEEESVSKCVTEDKTIELSQEELKAMEAVKCKQEKPIDVSHGSLKDEEDMVVSSTTAGTGANGGLVPKEEEDSDSEALKDVLALPGDLLDTDLVNTIMNEDNDELAKNADTLESLADSNLGEDGELANTLQIPGSGSDANAATKDELTDILGSHFNLDIPTMNSKDVEEIFKGVLTDESQESQESMFTNVFSGTSSQTPPVAAVTTALPVTGVRSTAVLPSVAQNTLNSPMSFPSQSPYHSEYSSSPQFSPAFSEPPSPWVTASEPPESPLPAVPATSYNQRSTEKMKVDEMLGSEATISAVLYANLNHPEWKTEFPHWNDRCKQILKKWRALSSEKKAPYLQQAKDNRSALRMKKAQQMSKESTGSGDMAPSVRSSTSSTTPMINRPTTAPTPEQLEEQEKVSHQQKSVREAEQERQWKHMQAMRQQQQQQQQQVIHDQRVQAMARVHRQMSDPAGGQFPQEAVQLSAPSQESSPSVPSAVSPRAQFISPAIKGTSHIRPVANPSPTFQQPSLPPPSGVGVRTVAVVQTQRPLLRTGAQPPASPFSPPSVPSSPHADSSNTPFPSSVSPSTPDSFQRPDSLPTPDPYLQSPQTPRPLGSTGHQSPSSASQQPLPQRVGYQPPPRLPPDPYAQAPSTPRPQFGTPRPQTAPFVQNQTRPHVPLENPEFNRHLRDLLQRQQFKKLDDTTLLPGKQRVWPPAEQSETQFESNSQANTEGTFRQPLPPGIVRPRPPIAQSPGLMVRQPVQTVGLRLPQNDPRMVGIDPRMRLIFQQQQQRPSNPLNVIQQQQFSTAQVIQRATLTTRPPIDPYEQLGLQKQLPVPGVRMGVPQPRLAVPATAPVPPPPVSSPLASSPQVQSETQEIPDHVTAEIEKLEQENGAMAEVEGVGDLLGGLADDDDELLAEMGADFNILEYADPELDALTGGEKTNILDSLDLEESEPDKEIKKEENKQQTLPKPVIQSVRNLAAPSPIVHPQMVPRVLGPPVGNPVKSPSTPSQSLVPSAADPAPPALASPAIPPSQPTALQLSAHQQQIQQQMQQQVAQAIAMGRPMAPGTRIVTPEGAVGIVGSNNSITVSYPPNFPQRVAQTQLQLQNQRMQLRMASAGMTRMVSVGPGGQVMHAAHLGPRGLGLPPPPPPPYPGPPPPYPGPSVTPAAQMGLRAMGSAHHLGPPLLGPGGLVHLAPPPPTHVQRRPLLLQEQPLLLEELLEEEKREQEKQMQNQGSSPAIEQTATSVTGQSLLSDQDYEKLRAEVLRTVSLESPPQGLPAQGLLPVTSVSQNTTMRQSPQWQQSSPRPASVQPPPPAPDPPTRVPAFNASLVPAPPLPPEHIVTEQDRQTQLHYEQWLNHQNAILTQQLKYYETEVQKLRKIRKSLNSKQRQLKKSGNQLAEPDALELKRISSEQAVLQKQLESSRKQSRQHGMLIQEYRNKQQVKQARPPSGQSPLAPGQQTQSPLGPPASSPIHSSTAHSPLLSPSASPMTGQHSGSSPLQSPSPLICQSPVGPVNLQSPGNQPSSTTGMSPLGMQPSPRIGTPHSQQGEESPAQSPSQMCLPPPTTRMTSPQHRRLVSSPVGYISAEHRPITQQRFVRPVTLQTTGFQQMVLHGQGDGATVSQRTLQMIQQRQLILQHQQQQQHRQQMLLQQQQQQQQQQQVVHGVKSPMQQQPPSSPMPPRSPMLQMMSPHHVVQTPQSPMPPKSPLVQLAFAQAPPPGSPMPRSPNLAQLPSPMSVRRPPSTSPAVPDRPQSVENPGTPRTPFTNQVMSHDHDVIGGGGNPNNPTNPIPSCPAFGRFGYFKLGLRGGSPMWSFGRGSKRPPTLPQNLSDAADKPSSSDITTGAKIKKESHISKVSILKKKTAVKVTPVQAIPAPKVASLVCADYNEFDDSSSTPPVTPPPLASVTSNKKVITIQKTASVNDTTILDSEVEPEHVMIIDSSPEEKHIQCESLVDYDYDNDKALVTTEVSLSSVAQQVDSDDISVIETFTQGELGDVISSPLESEVAEEYVLFPTDMVVDIVDANDNLEDQEFPDKEGEEEVQYSEMINIDGKNVEIVAIQSPTSSDEELIKSGKTREVTSESFRLNLMQGLRGAESQNLQTLTDTPESPDQEEMNVDPPSPEPFVSNSEDFINSLGDSEIVIIDPSIKSPEEINIATTKEDFEELIDGEKREEKMQMTDSMCMAKQLAEMHKYAVADFASKSSTQTYRWGVTSPTYSSCSTGDIIPTVSKVTGTSIPSASVVPGKVSLHVQTRLNVSGSVITTAANLTNHADKIVSSLATALSSSTMSSIMEQKINTEATKAKLTNKSTTPSLSLNTQVASLPTKIFEDECTSPDESICQDDPYSPIRKAFASEPFKKMESSVAPKTEITQEVASKIIETEVKAPITKSLLEQPKTNYLDETKKNFTKNINDNVKPLETMKSLETIVVRKSSDISKEVVQNMSLASEAKEKHSIGNICVAQRDGKIETMPASFITHTDLGDNNTDLDSKSVVISIPSPTPSQEQLLDNIAMQELETRRRDGKGLPTEFGSIEDVLNMIENITGDQDARLEDKTSSEINKDEKTKVALLTKSLMENDLDPAHNSAIEEKAEKIKEIKNQLVESHPVISSGTKSTSIPQLSPQLSPAIELTTNMANASQQLRTLLSSLQTNTVTTCSNVESVSKTVMSAEEPMISNVPPPLSSVVTSRIIQHSGRASPQVTNSAIAKNLPLPIVSAAVCSKEGALKVQSPATQSHFTSTSPLVVSSVALSQSPSLVGIITATRISSAGGIKLMPDHPKLPLITTVIGSHGTNSGTTTSQLSLLTAPVTSGAPVSMRKSTPSLNAMLQSHPAATVPQSVPGTITAASILGSSRPPLPVSNTSQGSAFVSVRPGGTLSTSAGPTVNKSLVQTTNLLHTQLTKTPLKRSKSIDDSCAASLAPHYLKKEDVPVRSESLDDNTQVSSTASAPLKVEPVSCKYSSMQTPTRTEDSQNVLLKQLLQNTGCASTQATTSVSLSSSTSLPIVPSLEAQLARPVPPTPTSLLPPLIQNDGQNVQAPKTTRHSQIMSRETSFVSRPPQKSPTATTTLTINHQQLHIDMKKCAAPSRTPSREELLSPPTPRSASQESSLQTPPLVVKKEATTTVPYPSPVPQLCPQEVKKELIDESSQHSEISDQSRSDIQTKEESMDAMDNITDKMAQDQAALDLKKLKRRHYQQKRRQNQLLSKEAASQPKKRARKSSKVEEDYDTFVENLMVQLRQLPPMTVTEPSLGRNFGVCAVFGSGDLSKLGTKGYDTRLGDLIGEYGIAVLPGTSDFYSTKPYGDNDPMPEKPTPSTQRLFYDQEFPPIRFDIDDDRKLELFCRDNETPDSIVSSSSPECRHLESPVQFPGLRLIEDDDEDVYKKRSSMSPVIPIVAPIPIRLKPNGPYLKDYADIDKENMGVREQLGLKSKLVKMASNPLKESGNVTVTLTLTSAAAEDIMGVLRDLANILHIPAPTSYQIVERTSTPPSHKLGLYRTKGKDGKEGAPIDIQSILNGAAKFCRHCDVVILNNLIRKRVSELPFLAKEPELLGDGDELYFCSSTCYMQFALMHRSPAITQDKAAAIVDHLCQDSGKQLAKTDSILDKCSAAHHIENMDVDEIVNSIKQECLEEVNKVTDVIKPKVEVDDSADTSSIRLTVKKPANEEPIVSQPPIKQLKGVKYKQWNQSALQPKTKYKRPSDKEIMETMFRMGITVLPAKIPDDSRKCMFCGMTGDAVADGPARLLNFDVDKWVHLNCALWSEGVYETVNGALMNLENALAQSLVTTCIHCQKLGATIHCFKTRCSNVYHLGCAVKDNCVFYKDKTVHCTAHASKTDKDNELTTLSVSRRVYVQRDENRQVAAVMHQSEHNHLLRVGSLIFLNVGQLLPHQLQNFHTANYIYPIGYKIVRFYWSMRRINKRCRYVCSIHDMLGRPEFRVLVQEPSQEDVEYRDSSPKSVWNRVLEPLAALRRQHSCVQLYPQYVSGEDLFGLTEPAVVRVLESLPGIETLSDYRFKYGRNPLLELPLAINPSGAARSEPKLRNQFPWKRPHTQRTGSSARPVFATAAVAAGEAACPYSKQFVHSKSSQYKKMKQEWRNNVYLARSKIQGLGLYAARDLEKHTMVIEYIGEIIRTELAETREKKYEAKNRGIYMFRLDEERVVDATLSGGLARYINHSCNPNCVAEIVEVDRDLRIIIFAKRRIARGEELAYDYKFDIEDDQHKISCMCGAPNCRKWMN